MEETFSSPLTIPVGLSRFELYLNRLLDCLKQATLSSNISLTLYKTPARQWAFYLEALSRLYKKIHDQELFSKLKDEFKLLEDQLGRIDFYDGWLKEFSAKENFPAAIIDYWKLKMDAELAALQQLLDQQNWMRSDFKLTKKILGELQNSKWSEVAKDKKQIARVIADDLDNFERDYNSGKLHFKDLENGVHEYRRQLRWFSIYAQALDGLIQLKQVNDVDASLKKYMTDAVLNSPFNKLSANKTGIEPIYIEAPNFYALSWIVNEIGILKDSGLRIKAITEAAIKTGLKKKSEAEAFAYSYVDVNSIRLEDIPAHTKQIAEKFMNEDRVLKRIRKDVQSSG